MTNLPDEQGRRALLARYADVPWLRAAVAAIPYAGGSLDIILSYRGQEVAKRRIEAMLASLRYEMASVKEDAVRRDFFESEEWVDLVRLALEAASRTRESTRLSTIARILRGTVTASIAPVAYAEDLIEVVAGLRDSEATVLREICQESLEGRGAVQDYGASLALRLPPGLAGQIRFILRRLEAHGLIGEVTGTILGYSGGAFELTSTGKELCALLASGKLDESET